MTKDKVDQLFTMLSQFYPNKSISDSMRLAWEYALEPYAYKDVKAAALVYARKNKFFPDLADLTKDIALPQDANATLWGTAKPRVSIAWMKPHVEALAEQERERVSVSRFAREHGMTWDEAAAALRENAL